MSKFFKFFVVLLINEIMLLNIYLSDFKHKAYILIAF